MFDFGKMKALVLEAGKLVTDIRLSGDVMAKGEADYVTRADVAVQDFLRRELNELCPGARFIAEENEMNDYGCSGETFILDPVDGTTNLLHGFGMSVVSLGYYVDGVGVCGVIYNPFTSEVFSAEKGQGAYLGNERIHCRKRSSFSECIAVTEFSPYNKDISPEVFEMTRRLFLRVQDIRSLGSAALGLAYVACGRADIFMCRVLKPWDYAAAAVILAEAGCRITNFAGGSASLDRPESIIAGADGIFDELAAFAENYA